MIYGTAVIGYCVYQLREPPGRSNWLLVLFLAAYCLLFTVVYLVFKDPYIHEVNNNEWREVCLSQGLPWLLRPYVTGSNLIKDTSLFLPTSIYLGKVNSLSTIGVDSRNLGPDL